MNIDGTTFVLMDYGTLFKPDLAFVETPIGTTMEDVIDRLLAGEYEYMRGVFFIDKGRFIDASNAMARTLAGLPYDCLSKSARDFVNYCGLECVNEAAE